MSFCDFLKAKQLQRQDGTQVSADQVMADNKVILFYFSAHWCPPCRGFTPILKDFYEAIEGKSVTIIFVSSDRNAEEMASYFSEHGDYYAVPFADTETVQALKTHFAVSGIPMLAVCKTADGSTIESNGRGAVSSGEPSATVDGWLNK